MGKWENEEMGKTGKIGETGKIGIQKKGGSEEMRKWEKPVNRYPFNFRLLIPGNFTGFFDR
jgi:hypothetical protein